MALGVFKGLDENQGAPRDLNGQKLLGILCFLLAQPWSSMLPLDHGIAS